MEGASKKEVMASFTKFNPALRALAGLRKRLKQFDIERIRMDKTHGIPPSGWLFHYTSVDGLKGIVENNEVWATSAYFLNDASEVAYGCDVWVEALKGWLAATPMSKAELPYKVAQELTELFEMLAGHAGSTRKPEKIQDIYLTSFCEDDNLLSQWRAYGQSGGYSLAFNLLGNGAPFRSIGIESAIKPESEKFETRLVKVEYDRSEQIARCNVLIDALLPILHDDRIGNATTAPHFEGMRWYYTFYSLICYRFVEEALGFKDKAFAVEREWRLIVLPRMFRRLREHEKLDRHPLYFRPTRGLLVPYLKLVPPKGYPLCIESVRSGPTIDRLSAQLSLRPFLDRHGFEKAQILSSDIPARF